MSDRIPAAGQTVTDTPEADTPDTPTAGKRGRKAKPQFEIATGVGENGQPLVVDDAGLLTDFPRNFDPREHSEPADFEKSFAKSEIYLYFQAHCMGLKIVALQEQQGNLLQRAKRLEAFKDEETKKKADKYTRLKQQMARIKAEMSEDEEFDISLLDSDE